MQRKVSLETGEIYHVFSKSIEGFVIFNNDDEFHRMMLTVCYYNQVKASGSLSGCFRAGGGMSPHLLQAVVAQDRWVDIVAYCLMPTHVHFVLRQVRDGGISQFMRIVLNSYARYFNIKHRRFGPLWASRFNAVRVDRDEYFNHLTRYVHLNPVTAGLIEKPEEWEYSSFGEYMGHVPVDKRICSFEDLLEMDVDMYGEFVEEGIEYQRNMVRDRKLMVE